MNTTKMGLTIEEAAECTGIGRNTMRKLVDWGKLPVLKVGRKTIIRTDTLEHFMTVNQGRNLLNEKDFLLSNSRPPIVCNPYTQQMDAQAGAIIDKEVTANVISGFINWEKYKAFKKAMYSVKSSEYDSDQKDDFIVQSYSLMNFCLTVLKLCHQVVPLPA